jgi:hypothetical protein
MELPNKLKQLQDFREKFWFFGPKICTFQVKTKPAKDEDTRKYQ